MASFAGALGQRAGDALQEHSGDVREERMKDEDYARETQLAKQRQRAEDQRLNRRLSAEDARQRRQIEAQNALEKSRQEFETGYRTDDREMEWQMRVMAEQSDMWQAAMNAYMSRSKSRSMSGGGWSSKVRSEQIIDENGQMVTREIADIEGPNGRPYSMQDGRILEVGQTVPPAQFASVDLQKKAEDDLKAGTITTEQFQRQFNYIPADYVFGKMSANDAGFQKFLETENIRLPAFANYMTATGDRRGSDRRDDGKRGVGPDARAAQKIFDEGASGGAEMRPSIEEMSDGPERDAYVAEHGTHAEQADAMREEAGLLTQGQAAAGELEQGGQMGPEAPSAQVAATAPGGEPVAPDPTRTPYGGKYAEGDGAAAAIYNQSGLAQQVIPLGTGGTISDEEAASISKQIQADMAGMQGGMRTY